MKSTDSKVNSYEEIASNAEQYVQHLLQAKIPVEMANLKNRETAKIFKNTHKLLKAMEVEIEDKAALLLAVIFTNSGFSESLKTPYPNSKKIAQEFLDKKEIGEKLVKKTIDCLRVKSGEKSAETRIEEIYEDAQNSIFADKKYVQKVLPAIQKRHQVNKRNPIETSQWLKEHRNELKNIDFNTKQAKKRYKSGVKENIKAIKALRDEKKKRIPVFKTPLDNRVVRIDNQ